MSSPVVLRQVRSKQFTAGIIDKIEDRYREIILPVPKGVTKSAVASAATAIIKRRAILKGALRALPFAAEFGSNSDEADPDVRRGYYVSSSSIRSHVYVPKYYDPRIGVRLRQLRKRYWLLTIGDLRDRGVISLSTGIEVGKLAYGLGRVPFIRTSDLANWELAGEPKQHVSEELYRALRSRVDIRPEDIFLVRDGTYLVGTSAIVTKSDAKALYAGGLYKIRVEDPAHLDPYLLLAILNTPIVKRQMRSKQFTRDIIDTLGKRIYEVELPIPRDSSEYEDIASRTRAIVEERAQLRDRAKVLSRRAGLAAVDEELLEEALNSI